MSNSEQILAHIEDELFPDITAHAFLVTETSVHAEVTVKVQGHPLSPWKRLRFRFGF